MENTLEQEAIKIETYTLGDINQDLLNQIVKFSNQQHSSGTQDLVTESDFLGSLIFVATWGDEYLGSLAIKKLDDTVYMTHSAVIIPQMRGQGIYASLYDMAEAYMNEMAATEIISEVYVSNIRMLNIKFSQGYSISEYGDCSLTNLPEYTLVKYLDE